MAGLSQREIDVLQIAANGKSSKEIGLPNGLNAVGCTEADIPQLVEGGWQQPRLLVGSPRPVTKADLSRILGESLQLW